MTSAALPTRRDEAYRYADLAALAPLWPVAVETIAVGAGEHRASLAEKDAARFGQFDAPADPVEQLDGVPSLQCADGGADRRLDEVQRLENALKTGNVPSEFRVSATISLCHSLKL